MGKADEPDRHWRVLAQELANEKDPEPIGALWEEMNRAVRFLRFEEESDTAPD